MTKVTCLNPIAKVGLERFGAGYQLDAPLEEAQLALVRSADMHAMTAPAGLLAVARAGAGVNNIPLDALAKQGTVVFNTPGANANGVKELVLAGMLLAARDVVGGVEWVRANQADPDIAKDTEKAKKQFAGGEILGKRLGIIGLGHIGVKVANAALALGMKVWAYTLPEGDGTIPGLAQEVHLLDGPEEIYESCDYITLHLPLNDATRQMINGAVFAKMKPGTVLLNFSRDKLVDDEALAQAMEQGIVRRYVSDFPNPAVVHLPGALVIPHLGASTEESEDNCACMAVDQLKAFLEEGTLRNAVNYPDCTLGAKTAGPRLCVLGENLEEEQLLAPWKVLARAAAQKGERCCLLADLETEPTPQQLEQLAAQPGVLRVRLI